MQRPFFSIATANMFPTALEAANPGKSSHCELWYGLAWVGSVPVPWMLREKNSDTPIISNRDNAGCTSLIPIVSMHI